MVWEVFSGRLTQNSFFSDANISVSQGKWGEGSFPGGWLKAASIRPGCWIHVPRIWKGQSQLIERIIDFSWIVSCIFPDISDDRLLLWFLPSLEPVEKSENRGERESCPTAVIDDLIKVSIDLYTSQHSVSCAFSYFHFTQEFHLSADYNGPWVKFTQESTIH